VALVEPAGPQPQHGRSTDRVGLVVACDHAGNEGIHADAVKGDAGGSLEGVQAPAHVGVEESVFRAEAR